MENIVEQLSKVLSPDQILTDSQLSSRYSHIWEMNVPLVAKAVLLPKSTLEVSEIMKICYDNEQEVIAHGGLTNLVGSTETKEHQIVISMEKLNAINEIDNDSRTMTVQAGVILQAIQEKATDNELMFPLNFGAKGSAQIGGIISTNAGGLRVLKFGMTRNLVLGLEVVLPDGTIISSLKKIIKDNSGYDLKQLYVGSEGTLGIITAAVIKLVEAPKTRNSAFLALSTYDDVVKLLKHMDGGLGGSLSGFELMWPQYYITATQPPSTTRPPLPIDHNYYVLVESLGSQKEQDRKVMEDCLTQALELGIVEDAVIADSHSDMEWFWKIRENVHAVASVTKYNQHFDISLPIPLIGEELAKIIEKLEQVDGVDIVFPFGHVADGNIHLIVGKSNETDQLREAINDIVYQPLLAIGGSVSAEHGIGVHKKKYLHLCRTEAEIELMKLLKRSLDPKGILNMGKVIDL